MLKHCLFIYYEVCIRLLYLKIWERNFKIRFGSKEIIVDANAKVFSRVNLLNSQFCKICHFSKRLFKIYVRKLLNKNYFLKTVTDIYIFFLLKTNRVSVKLLTFFYW